MKLKVIEVVSVSKDVVKVRVFRWHEGMEKPRYEVYEVPRLPKMTVLDALEYITEVLGVDLSYRSSCGIMRCGQCGVRVNGKSVLACAHLIDTDEITVEPLPNFPVLKDLVVDFSRVRTPIQRIFCFVRDKPPATFPEPITHEEMKEAYTFSQCIECKICASVCPTVSGYPEWPGHFFMAWILRFNKDPRDAGSAKEKRLEAIRDELWYCSACYACQLACPWEVPIWKGINDLRKDVVETGLLPRTIKSALTSMMNYGNPWGTASKRDAWLQDLKVPRLPSEGTEVLYFVGCTPSYDARVQNVARSMVAALEKAGVKFGILSDEVCCGEPALRIGELGLFEMLATRNIEMINNCRVDRVVTTCPHAYDVFVKEYPKRGSTFNAQHYTQFLAELIDKGRLKFRKRLEKKVTYHDPCFLGRHNKIYDEPRKILENIPGLKLIEMPRNKENSFCCGGGGGKIWFAEDPQKVRERPCLIRAREATSLEVEIIVTACPFCLINLEDGVKVIEKEETVRVMDLAELLAHVL